MAKVSFKTYGCSNNIAESEAMAGLLEQDGHDITSENAEVFVFNMCSVKGPSIKECVDEVKTIIKESPEKKIVVAGCVPRELIPELKALSSQVNIVGTHHIDKISEVIASDAQESFSMYDKKIKVGIPRKRMNPFVGIVPILSGCNDHCSYCSTVLIKGPTVSYPQELIVEEVKQAVHEGCKQIWLTSQDNGAYLTDKGSVGLPGLMRNISQIEGEFFVRVGMMNPTYVVECIDELIDAMKDPKMFRFLHIPIQSGNDRVLESMKRRYTIDQVRSIVKKFRTAFPDMVFATDIICGFPGETDEEFNDTLKVVKELEFDIVNISRYYARKGTTAAMMKNQVHGRIAKDRSTKLAILFKQMSLQKNQALIGQEKMVLVESQTDSQSIARLGNYRQVIINELLPLGVLVKVRVVDASTFHVVGEVM